MEWSFDQPKSVKMTPALREQLSEGERLNISFTIVDTDCPTISENKKEEKKDEAKVPSKIHMIWIGSELPEKYWTGPTSFSFLNPGDKKKYTS